jgi:hypothetical protein
VVGKGGRRVNMVKKCAHMYVNAKMLKLFYESQRGRDRG